MYIADEQAQGRFVEESARKAEQWKVHLSPFGVIPKTSNPHEWRLIVDLSSPEGHSVDVSISKELVSLHYVIVDEVTAHIAELGKGSSMAKMDVKQAYRNIPVHPADSLLLGMKWADKIYVDRALPFGLRSAPLIFSAVAGGLQWAMEERCVTWVKHYVDDLITVGETLKECSRNVIVMHETCDESDMQLNRRKTRTQRRSSRSWASSWTQTKWKLGSC